MDLRGSTQGYQHPACTVPVNPATVPKEIIPRALVQRVPARAQDFISTQLLLSSMKIDQITPIQSRPRSQQHSKPCKLKMSQAFSNNDNCTIVANSFNTVALYDRSEILAWLSPLEPQVRHRDIGARRVDSIGAWLLETEEFKCWKNGSRDGGAYRPILFCDGNPGVGKSYIV